jgi:hypothetical protein
LRYFYYCPDQYRRLVYGELGDCIRGEFKYIEEDPESKSKDELLVTTRGREFIKLSGLVEEFRKRRKRTTELLLSHTVFAVLAVIIVKISPWLNRLTDNWAVKLRGWLDAF